jgi:hypothetical protein
MTIGERAKGIVRIAVTILLGLIALAFLGSWINSYREFSDSLDSYYEVKPTDNRAEIRYRLGEPAYVLNIDATSSSETLIYETTKDADRPLPAGATIESFNRWVFPTSNNTVAVSFVGEQFEFVDCYTRDRISTACPRLADIGIEDSEEEVLKRLGKPTKAVLHGDMKTLTYDDLHISFDLEKGRVSSASLHRGTSNFLTRYLRWSRLKS